jgi:peroxiredoxin (alkyl hydroperoxide reductase subunit C)
LEQTLHHPTTPDLRENPTASCTPVSSTPLRIGATAPLFTARSTTGTCLLESYQGRWLMLFFHPADFTPVCTSEFVRLAQLHEAFAAAGCALLGVSADSVYAHLAWVADIEQRFGVRIPFPLVEDSAMLISQAYGLLDERSGSSATVRASFVIDPAGIVRAITWYPLNIGRNIDELLRLVHALQAADQHQVSTPASWQPGLPVLNSAPTCLQQLPDAALPAGWYYQERQL